LVQSTGVGGQFSVFGSYGTLQEGSSGVLVQSGLQDGSIGAIVQSTGGVVQDASSGFALQSAAGIVHDGSSGDVLQSTGGFGPQEGSLVLALQSTGPPGGIVLHDVGVVLQSTGSGGGGGGGPAEPEHSGAIDPCAHVSGGGGSTVVGGPSIGAGGAIGSSVLDYYLRLYCRQYYHCRRCFLLCLHHYYYLLRRCHCHRYYLHPYPQILWHNHPC
jgi:hypothetical protein